MLGETSTEQFPAGRFSQIQTLNGQSGSNNTVNFSDLLNLFVFRPDLNIGATIKAMEEQDLLQILAEPNLITLEGKDASFLAGGSFPFPVIATTPATGSVAPVITVQFKPFGVKLDFTPTVTPQGAIDLKVAPEVSSLDYTNAVTLEGYTIPALSERRAETEVILKDGESFAIAGLINNQVVQTLEKVPGWVAFQSWEDSSKAAARRNPTTNCWCWSPRISSAPSLPIKKPSCPTCPKPSCPPWYRKRANPERRPAPRRPLRRSS